MAKKPKINLSKKKFVEKKTQPSFLVQRAKGTAVFFCSVSHQLGKRSYSTLLTCIALKGTVYRTVFTKEPMTVETAKETLSKWAKTLPLKDLQYGIPTTSSVKL